MKLLAELLDAKEPLFSLSLQQLENASGNRGVDIKLKTTILERAHKAIRDLGLDQGDSTGREIYHALVSKIKEHDALLARSMGCSPDDSPAKLNKQIKNTIDAMDIPKSCWVIKRSVAKKLLKKTPPKNIMKRLNYRSVDSMLKKEKLGEIYGALRFAEDSAWLKKFNQQYNSLTPSNFENRKIEIVIMPAKRWADIGEKFVSKKKHNITHLKELGVIVMLPVKNAALPGMAIWTSSLLLHYVNEIRLYSAFFKLKQVQPNFGEIFVDTINADPDLGSIMAGQNVHWRVIQRYFGKLTDEYHPEIFEPHVQPEDLHWRKAEEVLCKITPELEFWKGLDHVGLMMDGRPVSFNIMDAAASYTNNRQYDDREFYHFRESLWNQIFISYMGQRTLEQQVLEQLDNDMIKPELFGIDT